VALLAVPFSARLGEEVMQSHDAVIIGGGPAGATAAILLARDGWRVAVVERKQFPRRKVCGEYVSGTTLPLLERLGVAEAFLDSAGPPVREVGLFAGDADLRSALPRPASMLWGRALSREKLDTLLMAEAVRSGAQVLQPFTAIGVHRQADWFVCQIRDEVTDAEEELRSPVVLAAHGSWEVGTLPTQRPRRRPRASDLLAFKAHFTGSALPDGLMPLLAYPGGYGGMVHCDDGRVSLSCCVRRDVLMRLRRGAGGEAGEAVLGHIAESCRAVRHVLDHAERVGPWLAAGPILPGIRLKQDDGIVRVGNAAGEAQPVIAEGISMAMQGAWLACEELREWRKQGSKPATLRGATRRYAKAWRQMFAARLQVSRVIAHCAMRPGVFRTVLPVLRKLPSLLTLGARLSGKATGLGTVRSPEARG
jgi:flavin-dependent dehydrogenase